MSFIRYLVLASGLLLVASAASCSSPPASAPPLRGGGEDELREATQELLDAVSTGKKSVWDRYLAEDAIYTDENGRTFTKKEFLAELRPLPAYAKGSLRVKRATVRLSGDHAILLHEDDEEEEIYGQKISAHFVTTDTWRMRQNRWELLAVHVTGLSADPVTAKLPPARLDAFAGEYAVSGGKYTVRREGDHLQLEREGRPPMPLFPEGDGIFFARGSTDRWVFMSDDGGRIRELRQRRRGTDVVWSRTR